MARTELEVGEATRLFERIDVLRKRLAQINAAEQHGTSCKIEINGSGINTCSWAESIDYTRRVDEPRWNADGIAVVAIRFMRTKTRTEMRVIGRRLAQLACVVPEDCQ